VKERYAQADMQTATNPNPPVQKVLRKARELLKLLNAPIEGFEKLSATPGPPRFWWFIAWAATIGSLLGWWRAADAVAVWIAWLACWLADVQRRLKNTEASVGEMQEGHVSEMREMLEMHEIGSRKAQRALAAILEVSVEFADVQRRLQDAESALSRLRRTTP
jgi:hypothetical protein